MCSATVLPAARSLHLVCSDASVPTMSTSKCRKLNQRPACPLCRSLIAYWGVGFIPDAAKVRCVLRRLNRHAAALGVLQSHRASRYTASRYRASRRSCQCMLNFLPFLLFSCRFQFFWYYLMILLVLFTFISFGMMSGKTRRRSGVKVCVHGSFAWVCCFLGPCTTRKPICFLTFPTR